MTYTSRSMFTVPLTSKAFKLAKSFQSQYKNQAKAKQVYLNTLAVYAVETYCDCLGINTDLESSDSLNPVMQPLMNIADLEIEGLGKIECRPVLPEEESCYIPVDTWENRIGYVAVEIDESSREATLLGFYPPVNALEMMEHISIDSFQPLEALIDHLDRLESGLDFFLISDDPVAVKFRERFNNEPLAEIVTQFERIYRTSDKCDRRYVYGEFLANYLPTVRDVAFRGGIPVVDKEDADDSQQKELQNLAEELLDKLDEIWGDDNSDESIDIESASNENSLIQPIEKTIIVPRSQPSNGLINISEWLQNLDSAFQANWQTLDSFFSEIQGNLIYRFASVPRSRSADTENQTLSVSKVRKITLGNYPVALIVNCQLESDGKYDILVRLYPINEEQKYLPQAIQLIILDEDGDVFLEAESRTADNWIQREFRGETGEQFSIKVVLEDASFEENFAI